MKNFKIFIQARIRSSRLPGKILFNFFDEKVIDRVIRATKKVNLPKNIFLLTGNKGDVSILKDIAKKHKINFFVGDEDNVLQRFCTLIKKENFSNTHILRITSDNYLIQPNAIKEFVKIYFKSQSQYMHVKPLSHFVGEIVSSKVLIDHYNNNPSKMSKEHVTWDIREKLKVRKKTIGSNFFKINHKKRIVLDTVSDLEFMKKIEKNYPSLKDLNCVDEIRKIKVA